MKKFFSISVFVLAHLLFIMPLAAQLTIYPTPHFVDLQEDKLLSFDAGVKVKSDKSCDPVALEALNQLFLKKGVKITSKGVAVHFNQYKAKAKGSKATIQPISGAYSIVISDKGIQVVGYDDKGLFYAVQTLRQIINKGSIPFGTIIDAPDLPFRGVVEGFYGTPWSHRDRIAQLEFYGQFKMNTYIYGPKDDPYHSSPHWRKPYPTDEADRIRDLVEVAKQNKVDFVWAIHPGKDIKWNEEDYLILKSKFEAMYLLGIRSFAFFFDDISGEGTKADRQAELLNRINREFIQVKADCTPLVMCPTEYNKSWSDPKPGSYLDILGTNLDRSIEIMWTGDRVCADITHSTLDWINNRIKRPAFIWWNFPVSDYVRNHLLMGPAYGNDLDIQSKMGGFVSNPMEHAESSKLALFGVADYTWNLGQYDYIKSWRAAIKQIMPEAADELEVFATHNADLGANGHGYRRDESWNMKQPVAELLSAFVKGAPLPKKSLSEVKEEFVKLATSPALIRDKASNKFLIEEMSPWLYQTELLGRKGEVATQLISIDPVQSPAQSWHLLNNLWACQAKSLEVNAEFNQNPYQPGVKSGTLVLQPFIDEVAELSAIRLFEALSGVSKPKVSPVTNFSNIDGWEQGITQDTTKHLYIRQLQKDGDWFGLDLGAVIDVKEIFIRQGRNYKDHDIMHTASLQYSVNGIDWTILKENMVEQYLIRQILPNPIKARYVRLVCQKIGSTFDPSRKNNWTAFRTFEVNPVMRVPNNISNITQLAKQPILVQNGQFALSPSLEFAKIQPGQFVGIEFPSQGAIEKLDVDFGSEEAHKSLKLETSIDGINWESGSLKTAKMVRYRNISTLSLDIKLNRFMVEVPTDPRLLVYDMTDGDLFTSFEAESTFTVFNPLAVTESIKPQPKKKGKIVMAQTVAPICRVSILGIGDVAHLKIVAVMNDGTRQSLPINVVNPYFATLELPANVLSIECLPSSKVTVAEVIWTKR